MSTNTSTTTKSLFTGLPSGIVPYVAILGALASTSVHLSLAPMILQFNSTRGILFVLAGLGFIGGIAVYLTKYWRREFYLVAIAFALAQIIAWAVMSGRVNDMAIISKGGEAVFAVAAAYLYWTDAR
jgi:hypothetical protein